LPKVKLIVGLIAKEEYLKQAETYLKRHFSSIDFESKVLTFNYTDYYKQEFGSSLSRKFISFANLIKADDLAKIKVFTNKLEKKLSGSGRRKVNIDPGYIDESKLVLATHKDFSHRIYLKNKIFAEVTLSFQDKTFRPWPWTYPDYRTSDYTDIFNQIREIYAKQIRC